MKKIFMLIFSFMVLVSMGGCGLKTPSYENATEIKMLDEDKEAYINDGAIDHKYTLYSHSVEFMWTMDEAVDAQKRLDKSLPKDKWRLVSDWAGKGDTKTSEWKNGDIGLLVVLTGNMDGTQISRLERRFGMTEMDPGATMIVMYTFDKTKSQPDKTATAISKETSMTKTASPSVKKTPKK